MTKPTIGIQIFSVRDDFYGGKPLETLKAVSEMGYETVELTHEAMEFGVENINNWLTEANLKCSGMTVGWEYILGEKLQQTLDFNKTIGSNNIVIGTAVVDDLKNRDKLKDIIKTLNEVYKVCSSQGFYVGYHAHYTDFFPVDGVTAWDRIMQATPKEFGMIIDTGNMLSYGADPMHYLKKYPGRSKVAHMKPFDAKLNTAATMIGEDSFNWQELVDTTLNEGKAELLIVEYPNFRLYSSLDAAKLCYKRLKEYIGG